MSQLEERGGERERERGGWLTCWLGEREQKTAARAVRHCQWTHVAIGEGICVRVSLDRTDTRKQKETPPPFFFWGGGVEVIFHTPLGHFVDIYSVGKDASKVSKVLVYLLELFSISFRNECNGI